MARQVDLGNLISKMRTQRQEYVDRIAEIDRTFAQHGINVEGAAAAAPARPRRGRPPGRPAKAVVVEAGKPGRKKRRRGRFATTGEESILTFVRSQNKPSTADINKHWRGEGRGGKADNTLTKLVQAGKLKRIDDPEVRGSRYESRG